MSYNCPKRGQQQMQQGMQQQQVQQPTQQLAQQQQPDMAAMAREVAREVARSMAEQMGTTAATSPRVDAGNREEMAANPIVQSVMDPMQLAQFKEGLLKDIKDMVDEAVADTQDTVQQGQKTLEKEVERARPQGPPHQGEVVLCQAADGDFGHQGEHQGDARGDHAPEQRDGRAAAQAVLED